jgi:hypothetical protein
MVFKENGRRRFGGQIDLFHARKFIFTLFHHGLPERG